jgi:hypothetical protein
MQREWFQFRPAFSFTYVSMELEFDNFGFAAQRPSIPASPGHRLTEALNY